MLVDITIQPEDSFQITRHVGGKVVLTIPLDLLIRSHTSYMANKLKFDEADRKGTVQ
jgi:predicted membrane protein